MAGFGFGQARSPRRMSGAGSSGGAGGMVQSHVVGALTRNEFGAGIPVSGSAITSGDAGGHWTVSSGRLFPSAAGDAADLNAGPYVLELDNGSTHSITIEADTWDITDQSEWDVLALQSAATLAGKNIALRNTSTLNLGIVGTNGTPFRRAELRNGSTPLTIKGRLGAAGDFANYCEIDKVQLLRGTRGLKFQHLKTTAVAEQKFKFVGEAANNIDDITIDDCWVRGQVGDPNGDYSTSSNYPMLNIDLIGTNGSVANAVGNVTVTNSLLEWMHSGVNIRTDVSGKASVITGNTVQYFYGDALAVTGDAGLSPSCTISDNFIINCVALPSDSSGPHPDAIRLQGVNTATFDWSGITIERNIILEGTARGDGQGIFLDDMKTGGGDSSHFFTATIRHNIVGLNGSSHGITVNQAKNCVVENNSVFAFNEAATSLTMSIAVGDGSGNATSGGGNTVQNNIADSFSIAVGSTTNNNFEAGQNGASIAYTTLFAGPTFAPLDDSEAKASLNPTVAAGAVIP